MQDRRVIRDSDSGGAWICTVQQRVPLAGDRRGSSEWLEHIVCFGTGPTVTLDLKLGEFSRLSEAELLERITQARR